MPSNKKTKTQKRIQTKALAQIWILKPDKKPCTKYTTLKNLEVFA
jgi:hypothetical protein